MTRNTIVLIIPLLILVSAFFWFITEFQFLSWDFRNNLWAVAYLLLNGEEPYSVYQHFPGTNALWLPMTVGLFLPLGMMEASLASNLWLLANIAMLGMVIWIAAGSEKPSLKLFTLVLLLAFFSPLVVSHLYFGQITIFFILMSLLAVKWRYTGEGFLSGLLVAASLAKPQLAIFFLPGLLMWFWKEKKTKGAFLFLSGITTGTLILSSPFWMASPQWWSVYIEALQQNPSWAHPNLFTFLQLTLGQFGLIIWIMIALLLFGINAWLWLRYEPTTAAVWCLSLTAVASPYLFSYDFALVIPLFVWVIIQTKPLAKRLYVIVGWLLGSSLMIWIRYFTDNDDRRYWWFPLFILTWILLLDTFSHLISRKRSAGLTLANPKVID